MAMISVLRTAIRILGNIACIVAAVILFSAMVMILAGIKPAVIVSGSMEPVIHTGSIALIDSGYEDVKERDIIAFDAGGVLVTHRVVQVTDEGYVTKGDANRKEDPGIRPKSALRGRVIIWLPWIGYAVKTMGTPAGMTALAAFCLLLLLLYRLTGKEDGLNEPQENTDCPDSHAA
ncbi:MAG: signal peptidase I [Clostridia bacterium]|nr:signal peptidase I [Clostridia bacterium]